MMFIYQIHRISSKKDKENAIHTALTEKKPLSAPAANTGTGYPTIAEKSSVQ